MKSILIADDNAGVRYALRTFLEGRIPMRICGEAADGVEAIEKAEKYKPDVILLDLSMPRINGAQAALAIRKVIPKAHIVVFTLHSDLIGKDSARALGVDVVIPKSAGASGLLEALRPLLADP